MLVRAVALERLWPGNLLPVSGRDLLQPAWCRYGILGSCPEVGDGRMSMSVELWEELVEFVSVDFVVVLVVAVRANSVHRLSTLR